MAELEIEPLSVDLDASNNNRGRIRRDLLIVSTACLLLLVPFIHRPVSMDDPPYVWVARQINIHPFDFYGFQANWYGTLRPMYEYNENPPLGSYYIAALGTLTHWRLPWIHAGFALVAVLTSIGVYLLAGEFCRHPLAASLLFLICPGILVSAISLMYDVPMLGLWTWSLLLWVRGCRLTPLLLPIAGLIAAAAVLTKFTAINLVPLMMVYMLFHRGNRRIRGTQMVSLVMPISALLVFEWYTSARYGHGSITGATQFSLRQPVSQLATVTLRTVDSLAYLGGAALAAALVLTIALGRFTVAMFGAAAVLLACYAHACLHHANGWLAFSSIARGAGISAMSDGKPVWSFDCQFGVLSAAGLVVLAGSMLLCVRCTRSSNPNRRGKEGLFLCLWIAGVFFFATYLNWKINTRTMLPMLPAVCIVAMRIIELRPAAVKPLPLLLTAIFSGILALIVAFGDYQVAVANMNAAAQFARPGHRVWFSGHWGFQYYMQEHGALALDEISSLVAPGDELVVPLNNYGSPHLDRLTLVGKLEVDPGIVVTTMSQPMGANFYGSDGNQLPFAIGKVPPEAFVIFRR